MSMKNREAMYQGKEGWGKKWGWALGAVLLITLLVILAGWLSWGGHLLEWLGLVVRWFHVIVGIAWIGSSFYFIWLENHLEREGVEANLAGSLYSVHGGGFYYIQKYQNAPDQLPETLHWFQWEAYLTWISGFSLLVVVYYANAQLMMVGPGAQLSAWLAILIGLATLALGWLVYDRLCRSPLIDNKPLFSAIGFVLVTLLALLLTQVLSARAAYMHVGAMLGTLMAANVFFVIIPAHRDMVRAVQDGRSPDPALGKHASLRSLHNNYLTLPVIFVMISNHYPSTFGNTYNWLVLAGLFLASAGIRHYLNLSERGQQAQWILPAASLVVLALALVTAPVQRTVVQAEGVNPTPFSEVHSIIQTRCAPCHSATPTDDVFTTAPKGVTFDTPAEISSQAELIYQNAVLTSYMPLGNKTGMTEEERELLGRWIAQGAQVN